MRFDPNAMTHYEETSSGLNRLSWMSAAWNEWRHENPDWLPDFRQLHSPKADLSGKNLSSANFEGAYLKGADFRNAALAHVNFVQTDLREANFEGASLVGAVFNRSLLAGANLQSVRLDATVFANVDLHSAKGLPTCRFSGPSSIDVATLKASHPLPLEFLRGCGLPEAVITYLPSLFETAIQFYSCFISYSTADQDFADRLYADLQNRGVRCWFAPHDIQGGKKIHEQIDEAIRVYDRLLLILSPASMNSEWVRTEIAKARKRELQEHRRMLFPVRLVGFNDLRAWECFDSDSGKDSASEIREYYVPDFSSWKHHDSYIAELEKLVRDLKPSPPAKSK